MKQEKSKISVLMSVYKKENPEYLRASLESILVQTRTADEILLIEDGPLTQELYQVVAEYQKKCDYVLLEVGMGGRTNVIISMCMLWNRMFSLVVHWQKEWNYANMI